MNLESKESRGRPSTHLEFLEVFLGRTVTQAQLYEKPPTLRIEGRKQREAQAIRIVYIPLDIHTTGVQSMRYLRLKNARRWKISQIHKLRRAAIMNQAKFCTRSFVDSARKDIHQSHRNGGWVRVYEAVTTEEGEGCDS